MSSVTATPRILALDIVSAGGSSRPFNEDAAGWTRTAAWIVDGATSLDASAEWYQTSARWMAATTHNLLTELSLLPAVDTRALVRGVVEGLSHEWNEITASRPELLPPAGSLGLVLHDRQRNRLELTVIGDCLLVWSPPNRAGEVVITDVAIAATEASHGRHVAKSRPSSDELQAELIENRRMYMEGDPGWIISTNPRVADHLRPLVVEDPAGDLVLIASDGFARAVELPEFHHSWGAVMKSVWSEGLASVLHRLRAHEQQTPSFGEGRYKTSDDASALLLQVAGG